MRLSRASFKFFLYCSVVLPKPYTSEIALTDTKGTPAYLHTCAIAHPYSLTGTVTNGQHLGRRLGIPTANFPMPQGLLVPAKGVYAARVQVGEKWFDAVTNLGTRPTVQGEGILIESWLLDFSGDLYGQEIRVAFYAHLRPEQRFPSVEAMKQEILRNAEQTREYFKVHSQKTG